MNVKHQRYAEQGLRIISVNLDKEKHLAERFLADVPASFEVVYDPEGELAEAFGLIGMPTAYLIDHDGAVRRKHVGFRNDKKSLYETEIVELIGTLK